VVAHRPEETVCPSTTGRTAVKTNTDYRGHDPHLADDGTLFAEGNPHGDELPDGVYPREDGGVADTRYRDRDTHLAGDATLFAGPEDEND
jgi:hypothetical protein